MAEAEWVHKAFGFMDKNGLDELILDNACCQDGLKGRIEGNGYKSPELANARRKVDLV